MKYICFLFYLFPFLILSQGTTTNYGYSGKESSEFNPYGDRRDWMKEVKGTRFYHDNFLSSIIDGKEVKIKFDAYSDIMVTYIGPDIRANTNFILLLDQRETWIGFNNKWYQLLAKKEDKSYLFKPIINLIKAKKADSGFEGNKPAEFKLKERFFVLENNLLTKIKKKEIKKLGLLKVIRK